MQHWFGKLVYLLLIEFVFEFVFKLYLLEKYYWQTVAVFTKLVSVSITYVSSQAWNFIYPEFVVRVLLISMTSRYTVYYLFYLHFDVVLYVYRLFKLILTPLPICVSSSRPLFMVSEEWTNRLVHQSSLL